MNFPSSSALRMAILSWNLSCDVVSFVNNVNTVAATILGEAGMKRLMDVADERRTAKQWAFRFAVHPVI